MDNTDRRIKLGKNIQKARSSQGLNQRELAAMSCVAQSYIAEVELGKHSVGFDKLCQIADSLGTSVSVLVDGC